MPARPQNPVLTDCLAVSSRCSWYQTGTDAKTGRRVGEDMALLQYGAKKEDEANYENPKA